MKRWWWYGFIYGAVVGGTVIVGMWLIVGTGL